MAKCVVCETELKSTISVARYCVECRRYVAAIQNEVSAKMRRAKLPDVKQFSCVDCGAPATDYEHRYYSLPLEVDPVCSLCNQRRDIALDVVEMVRERRGLNAEDQRDEPEPHPLPLDEVLDSAERKFITEALRINHGNSAAAARYLGIKYRSMRHRLSRLQIGNSPLPAHKPPSKL